MRRVGTRGGKGQQHGIIRRQIVIRSSSVYNHLKINQACVCNDISIGSEERDDPLFLLVTGPNMGGKSTLLRQVHMSTS